jgi:surfactin synthase thioesterase subunit
MGTILAYELSWKLIDSGYGEPVHIFFSGRYPPHFLKETKLRHLMTDNEIIEEMTALGGMSGNLLKLPGLLKLFIRTLRADYKMIDTYRNVHPLEKYHFDISVFRGKEDAVFTGGDIDAWKEYTDKTCMIYEYDGGHFFLHDRMEDIAGIINNTLNRGQMNPIRMVSQYGQ